MTMLLDRDRIVPEPADHAALFGILQDKLVAGGVSLRDAVMMPVTPEGVFILTGCLATPGNEALAGNTWMIGTRDAPVGAKTKHVVFLDGIVDDSGEATRAAMDWLVAFSKKLKIGRKLKDLTFHVACFFTSSDRAVVGNGIKVIAALKCKPTDNIGFFSPAGSSISLDQAVEKFGWEKDFSLKERHEMVLDNLKSELWG